MNAAVAKKRTKQPDGEFEENSVHGFHLSILADSAIALSSQFVSFYILSELVLKLGISQIANLFDVFFDFIVAGHVTGQIATKQANKRGSNRAAQTGQRISPRSQASELVAHRAHRVAQTAIAAVFARMTIGRSFGHVGPLASLDTIVAQTAFVTKVAVAKIGARRLEGRRCGNEREDKDEHERLSEEEKNEKNLLPRHLPNARPGSQGSSQNGTRGSFMSCMMQRWPLSNHTMACEKFSFRGRSLSDGFGSDDATELE